MLASTASPASEGLQSGAPHDAPSTEVAVESDSKRRSDRPSGAVIGVAAVIVLLLGTLIFALNMRRGLNHDEHQFIAGGVLMAQNLAPYRDFAWFHVPGLAWLYALLFSFSDRLLLTARMLSIMASTGTLALLMGVALWRLVNWQAWARVGVGALTLLLLVATPGYSFASGRAWNHDVAVLLALGSFVLLMRAIERGGVWPGVLLSGLLLGLSASTRLTLAPLALPFLLAPLCWGVGWRRALRIDLWLALGVAIGLAPVWFSLFTAPDAFLFGNLRYAALNTQWYAAQGANVSLWGKVATTLGLLVQPGNLILLALTAVAFWRARHAMRHDAGELRFWLLALPFLLLGALAATPMQVQYLFALFPFAALGLLLALRYQTPVRWFVIALGTGALVAALLAAQRYGEGLATLPFPREWYPNKIHQRGALIAQLLDAQTNPDEDALLFTLSPILPLEGKVRIDTRTATGPFGWRVASLLTPDERTHFGLLSAEDLADALQADAPRALLTAMHSDDEVEGDAALEGWARAQGFVAVPLPDEGTLWLSPQAQWGTIRVGAQSFPRRATPGETIHGTLYLESDAPTTTNLNLLLRAVDAQGHELFRFDGWPFGSATSSWQPGALWQDGHEFVLPDDAANGNYRLEATFYDPATLESVGDTANIGWITVMPDETPAPYLPYHADVYERNRIDPNPNPFPQYSIGPGVELVSATPGNVSAKAGELVHFDFVASVDSIQPIDYVRYAHLYTETGEKIAQADQPPLLGFFPTSQWRTGEMIYDFLDFPLPESLAPGRYHLRIGLYDPATLKPVGGADVAEIRIE